MDTYLISFPASGMAGLSPAELAEASVATRRVVDEAKATGCWVFGGALDADAGTVVIGPEGEAIPSGSGSVRALDGGFALLRLPSEEEAQRWAGKLAAACGCPQELRVFHFDPES